MQHPSTSWPTEAKKRKHHDIADQTSQKVAKSVDNMVAALRTSAAEKRQAASIALQFKIMKGMKLSDEQLNIRLESLMTRSLQGNFILAMDRRKV